MNAEQPFKLTVAFVATQHYTQEQKQQVTNINIKY